MHIASFFLFFLNLLLTLTLHTWYISRTESAITYCHYTNCHTVWWSWSYGSWIYNYLCNQCLSPLMLWVRISIRARCTTLCDKVCQWLATGRWFSPSPPVSSTNKTDRHDIAEILLKVALNTIKRPNKQTNKPYLV
jgi:transposase